MVVGNGLIAGAFSCFSERKDVVIFASGVSNSKETSVEAFLREENLLNKYRSENKLLVYFSTFSVFDPSLSNSAYVMHKKRMEQLVQSSKNSHLIFRLPIMVGGSKNPHTLINFLANKIKANEVFTLHANACRYLLSISDLSGILTDVINDSSFFNQAYNISSTKQLKVLEIVAILENILDRKARFETVESGSCYKVEVSKKLKAHENFSLRTAHEMLTEYYS